MRLMLLLLMQLLTIGCKCSPVSTFTSSLQYVRRSDGLACISNVVRFYLRDDRTGEYIETFRGALTNFATIHWIFRFIFPQDHEDYKMPSAFHDLLVNEFGQQIFIMEDGQKKRTPTWQESAMWFRVMMKVRARARRNKRVFWKNILGIPVDFLTRWTFWLFISAYGLVR